MNKSYESGHWTVDVDKNDTVDVQQKDEQSCKGSDRACVNVLLDVSEDQDGFVSHTQPRWEGAIQGWERASPLACLFQTQRKGRRVKSDSTDSHCVLCADLKDLKVSESLVSDRSGSSAELSCDTAKEPLKNTISITHELLKRTPSNASSSSSSEEEKSDFNFVRERNTKSVSLGNEVPFEGDACIDSQTLLHSPQHNMQWSLLRNRGEEKMVLISTLIVLPPVKASAPAKPKSSSLLKRRETPDLYHAAREANTVAVCGTSGQVVFGERLDVDGELGSPNSSSTLDAYERSHTSKQRQAQHQYHMLSALSTPVSKRHRPISTLADPVARATSFFGRHLKQDELTRPSHSSGHRLHFGFRSKNVRKAEPELPVLLGTRVAIPVSTQRLL